MVTPAERKVPTVDRRWVMVVDIDKCTGCEACVVACQAENNIPLNLEPIYRQRRVDQWIRIERYWEGDFPEVKARFIPMMCQQCNNAPCEPVCPVYATYHNTEGLSVQVYNRCVGTRFCQNNCPYHMRFFNYWEPTWPESLLSQLNPDVTVRTRGIMEKCSFCVQRIRRAERQANAAAVAEAQRTGGPVPAPVMADNAVVPACVQACPTGALAFGDVRRPDSTVSKLVKDARNYRLRDDIGTDTNVIYLKKVDPHAHASGDTAR